ncbi:unnamed protein product [Gordionus sp. m RMFG-2023]
MASKFIVKDDVLYRKIKNKETLVIMEEEEKQRVISIIHQGSDISLESKAIGAHLGINKTQLKLSERYWWPKLFQDTIDFIKSCDRCQKANIRFTKISSTLHPIDVPPFPWAQIGIDLCSLPTSEEGYTCIAVASDYFTKWVEAEPMKSKTANETCKFIYGLICRHGCGNIQINDQGREFVNEMATRLYKMNGTEQRSCSAYHPQANGLTERNNRTIQNLMLKVLGNDQTQWPKVLPDIGGKECGKMSLTLKNHATFVKDTIPDLTKQVEINDQGREFVNQVSNKYHKLVGTQQRVTSAYYPQANGMVERSNCTLQNSLLKCTKGNQKIGLEFSQVLYLPTIHQGMNPQNLYN